MRWAAIILLALAARAEADYSQDFQGATIGDNLTTLGWQPNADAWTVQNGLTGGKCGQSTNNVWNFTTYTTVSFTATDFQVRVNPAGNRAIIGIRQADYAFPIPAGGYQLQWFDTGDTWTLFRNGTVTTLATGTITPANTANFLMRLKGYGNQITAYIDGSTLTTVTDSTYAGPGYITYGGLFGAIQFDDVTVDEMASTPTNTPTSTKTNSPTPNRTPTMCAAPFPRVFTPMLTPIFLPQKTWEAGAQYEPSVLKIGTVYHMTYGGGWGTPYLGKATSMDGRNWTRIGENPIIGNGYGGEAGTAARGSQLEVDGEYRIYYKNSTFDICYSKSGDGSVYTFGGEVIDHAALDADGVIGFDSIGFWRDGSSASYFALVDTEKIVNESITYRIYLFLSVDNAVTFQPVAGPLDSMLPGGDTTYGSPRAFIKQGDFWHAWYLVGVPSTIYHAMSPDLYNWFPYTTSNTLTYSANMFGLTQCNQAADPDIETINGRTYIYYDGTDNTNQKARIGMAKYCGVGSDLGACAAFWCPGDPTKDGLLLDVKPTLR